MLGRFIQLANAGLSRKELECFYPLKQKLLARFGKLDGHDWQYVEKVCFSCNGDGDYNGWEYFGDFDSDADDSCPRCNGSGYFKRFWTKLERRKIGNIVFHTPVKKSQSEPDEPFEITISGYVNHAPVSHRKALWAFIVLATAFDFTALISLASRHASLLRFTDVLYLRFEKRDRVLDDLPF